MQPVSARESGEAGSPQGDCVGASGGEETVEIGKALYFDRIA